MPHQNQDFPTPQPVAVALTLPIQWFKFVQLRLGGTSGDHLDQCPCSGR